MDINNVNNTTGSTISEIRDIERFKEFFKAKHGVEIRIIISENSLRSKISLSSLECFINDYLKKELIMKTNGLTDPEIRTADRRAPYILYRCIFYKLALVCGYKEEIIGTFLGKNRTTIISALNRFNKLLSVNDKIMKTAWENVLNDFIKKFEVSELNFSK